MLKQWADLYWRRRIKREDVASDSPRESLPHRSLPHPSFASQPGGQGTIIFRYMKVWKRGDTAGWRQNYFPDKRCSLATLIWLSS